MRLAREALNCVINTWVMMDRTEVPARHPAQKVWDGLDAIEAEVKAEEVSKAAISGASDKDLTDLVIAANAWRAVTLGKAFGCPAARFSMATVRAILGEISAADPPAPPLLDQNGRHWMQSHPCSCCDFGR